MKFGHNYYVYIVIEFPRHDWGLIRSAAYGGATARNDREAGTVPYRRLLPISDLCYNFATHGRYPHAREC